MKIGIQGEKGSACDMAAAVLLKDDLSSINFVYLTDAKRTLRALEGGDIKCAVLVMESPLGAAVQETRDALAEGLKIREIRELKSEVRHCIMVRPEQLSETVTTIASHQIPLHKHREFLIERFPLYLPLEMADTGLAAQELAAGHLPPGTAVIALPRAAEVFGLNVIETELPANDNYLTRFALVERAT